MHNQTYQEKKNLTNHVIVLMSLQNLPQQP